MAELPVPVEVPDFKVKSPPAKSAVPAIAPPLEMVKPCPAVAAVVFLSIPNILAAVPPNARIEPGFVVPMPTLPSSVIIILSTEFVLNQIKPSYQFEGEVGTPAVNHMPPFHAV